MRCSVAAIRAGRRTAEEHYSCAAMARRYEKVYEQLLELPAGTLEGREASKQTEERDEPEVTRV